jgi:hypothetical protein
MQFVNNLRGRYSTALAELIAEAGAFPPEFPQDQTHSGTRLFIAASNRSVSAGNVLERKLPRGLSATGSNGELGRNDYCWKVRIGRGDPFGGELVHDLG